MGKKLLDVIKTLLIPLVLTTISLSLKGYLITLSAIFTGEILNAALLWNQGDFFSTIGKLLLVLLINILIMPAITYFVNLNTTFKLLKYVRIVTASFFSKSYIEVSSFNRGDLSYRLENDVYELSWNLINFISILVSSILVIIVVVLQLSKLGVLIALVCLLLPLLKVVTHLIMQKYDKQFFLSQKKYGGKIRDCQSDLVTSRVFIENMGISKSYLKFIDSIFMDFYQNSFIKTSNLRVIYTTINNFLGVVLKLGLLIFLSYYVSLNLITVGIVATVILYFEQLSNIYENLFKSLKRYSIIHEYMKRITNLYSDSSENKLMMVDPIVAIEGIDLSMSFDKLLFENLNFKVRKGEKFAILGSNGSGKSTLLKIMLGLIEPINGYVKVNNKDIMHYDNQSYLNQVTCIEQSPMIFSLSITDNIQIAKDLSNQSHINDIMNLLHLNDAMNASSLSGGEIQRINLARCLIRKNDIIFMDEPTNSLDQYAKGIMSDLLSNPTHTIVYITHDPELLSYATTRFNMS